MKPWTSKHGCLLILDVMSNPGWVPDLLDAIADEIKIGYTSMMTLGL